MQTATVDGKELYFDEPNKVWRDRITDLIHVPKMRPDNTRYKQGLIDLANKLPAGLEMVEVGAYAGESTVIFAARMKSVIVVDPWENGYASKNPSVVSTPMHAVQKAFDERVKPFDNIVAFKCTSERLYRSLLKKFDFVYIDGDHRKEEFRKDVQMWIQRIKPDGWIGGHDYTDENWGPGIRDVVNDILGKPDHVFDDGSWLINMQNTKDAIEEWQQQQAEVLET